MVLHGSLPSGNIPNLTYKTRIKEHVGTQIWEALILPRVGCDLGASKWESPHLSAWFLCIPCALATPNLVYITLTESHVGAPNTIWEDLNSTRINRVRRF